MRLVVWRRSDGRRLNVNLQLLRAADLFPSFMRLLQGLLSSILQTGWRTEGGGWTVKDGGWRTEDGGWRMEDGGWRVDSGGWRMEGGGADES